MHYNAPYIKSSPSIHLPCHALQLFLGEPEALSPLVWAGQQECRGYDPNADNWRRSRWSSIIYLWIQSPIKRQKVNGQARQAETTDQVIMAGKRHMATSTIYQWLSGNGPVKYLQSWWEKWTQVSRWAGQSGDGRGGNVRGDLVNWLRKTLKVTW